MRCSICNTISFKMVVLFKDDLIWMTYKVCSKKEIVNITLPNHAPIVPNKTHETVHLHLRHQSSKFHASMQIPTNDSDL